MKPLPLTEIAPRDSALVSLDLAGIALSQCHSAMEANDAVNNADKALLYLERANAGRDTIAKAREIRLRAERKLGQFLRASSIRRGRRRVNVEGPRHLISLAELGISRDRSSQAQTLAAMSEEDFEAFLKSPAKPARQERLRRFSHFDSRLATLPTPDPEKACAELVGLIGTMQTKSWRGVRPLMGKALVLLAQMARRDGYSLRVVAETALIDVP